MKTLAMILVALFATLAIAQDTDAPSAYLCIPDFATGFSYEDGSWRPTSFDVSAAKYMLRRPKDSDYFKDSSWLWGEFGDASPTRRCDEINDDGIIKCEGLISISVNTKNLRYQRYYRYGYIDGNDHPENTPLIEIGKCNPL